MMHGQPNIKILYIFVFFSVNISFVYIFSFFEKKFELSHVVQ